MLSTESNRQTKSENNGGDIVELHRQHPVNQLKALFANQDAINEKAIRSVYEEDVLFRDPASEIRGVSALVKHMLKLYANLESCRFDYIGDVVGETSATIRWVMTLYHPRLNRGKAVQINGMTYIEWQEKISFHEDAFDLGAMFYEHLPLVGRIIRGLKRRIAAH